MEIFNQKLSEVQFPDYSSFENVNEAYADISSKLIGVIDSIAPLKQIRLKTNTKPWFVIEVLEKIRIRKKSRKKYKKFGLQIDFDIFKNVQKLAKKVTKSLKM